MDKETLELAIKEYLKDNLSVTVDIGYDYCYDGRRIEVSLILNGEVFSQHSDRLPE